MALSRKETRGGRSFAAPLFGVLFLLACYWVLAEWQDLPKLISAALGIIKWTS
jgi:hypothetical protein